MSDIVERAQAALEGTTPGPWDAFYHHGDTSYPSDSYNVITERTGDRVAEVDDESRDYEEPHGDFGRDAHFIAAARTLVPELVAEVKRLRWQIKHEGLEPVRGREKHAPSASAEAHCVRRRVDRLKGVEIGKPWRGRCSDTGRGNTEAKLHKGNESGEEHRRCPLA